MGVLKEQAFRKGQAERVSIAQNRRVPDNAVCTMPTYEYECEKCRKTFEIFQSMKDSALSACPESHCRMRRWGKGKVRRLLGTGAGLIFKGSGFYSTDYRSESYKQAAKKEGSSGEKSQAPEKSSAEAPKPEKSPKE
jgi:putative FmdB family regulatory protein